MNPDLVFDGFTTAQDGMNNGRDASLLKASELHLLINGTCRGDYVKQRPGFRRLLQILPPNAGLYQHAGWLLQRNGKVLIAVVAGGRFYRVDPLNKTAAEFTIPGDPNPSTLMQGWSISGGAEGFWVYNDGQSLPLIWNGSGARRASLGELHPGTVISYVQGRIWYSLPDGLAFRATDLVGNRDSGTAGYDYKDSILRETENTYLNEGGDFSVPFTTGGIRAMSATAVLDTSQGQGPLQVFCETGAFSVNTPVDRTIWKDVQYPIQTTSLLSSGFVSAQATVHVNGDIFGRANDGLRSFIVARRNFRDWGNTAQSFEVSELLQYDQEDLLTFSSAAVFDNRLLTTLSPRWTGAGVAHRGLVALDLAPISTIRGNGLPHYDGIWTGLNILTILQTSAGTFCTVMADDGSIDLWQVTKDDLYDDQTGRIAWSVFPRRLFVERDVAGRPVWKQKKLRTADLFYDQLAGSVHFSMNWKPDGFPCWSNWKDWDECAPVCQSAPGCTPATFQKQYQPRMRLSDPPDLCAQGAKGIPLRDFYELDLRLDVIGPARLRGVRVGANPQLEPQFAPNCDDPECLTIECCEYDPFTYVSHGTAGTIDGGSGGSGGSGGGGGGGGTGGTTDEEEDGLGGDNPPPPPPPPPPVVPPVEPPPTPPPPTDPTITGPTTPFVSLGTGALTYQPEFADPETGITYPLAFEAGSDPITNLQPGVLELWVADVQAKFLAEGIAFTEAQLYFQTTSGSQLAMNPNMFYQVPPLNFKAAWITELWIEYKI